MTGPSLIDQALAKLDRPAAAQLVARQAQREPELTPTARLIRGDTVKLETVPWLWRYYLPAGMLVILGGAPGCGKTTIALSLGAIVTRAGIWPDGTRFNGEAGDVLIWSGEDPAPVLAPRLVASGADMRRVHFVDGVSGGEGEAFDPGRDMPALELAAAKLAAPRLLILDPIVSAVAGDGHKSNDVRRALQPVVDLAKRLGCAVIGITHFSKGTAGRDPVERITGSLAFAALARVVLVAAKVKEEGDDEPRRVMVRAKSNCGPDGGGFAYALERVDVAEGVEGQRAQWLETLEGTAREVLAEAETDPAAGADSPADIEAFVRGCLASGPVSANAFRADAAGAGYQWHTVQRAARRIGAESRKDGMHGGWRWGFHGTPKATNRPEGDEGNSTRRLSSSSSSSPSLSPSDDAEVL